MDKTDKREYRFIVETIRAGQPRAYADSEYEYRVEISLPIFANIGKEMMVRRFCTEILKPCHQTYKEWCESKRNEAAYFAGYYTFEKLGENTYRYYVKNPFCG